MVRGCDGDRELLALNDIWSEFACTKNARLRDLLVRHYEPLVKYVASGFRIPQESVLEWNDLVGAGNIGLIEAVDRFDPQREIKFETYASLRIRGAIVDMLRNIDWAPRMIRKNVKRVIRAMSDLQSRLSRSPLETEIAEEIGLSIEDYHKILDSMVSIRFVSLQDVIYFDESEFKREQFIEEPWSNEDNFLEDSETQQQLNESIKELPAKERLILTLYYYEGLNLAEIGATLGVTESRACQMHAQSLLRLKTLLCQENVYGN
jgi:RNA polymerase sigma factor for flagellar operon FliA